MSIGLFWCSQKVQTQVVDIIPTSYSMQIPIKYTNNTDGYIYTDNNITGSIQTQTTQVAQDTTVEEFATINNQNILKKYWANITSQEPVTIDIPCAPGTTTGVIISSQITNIIAENEIVLYFSQIFYIHNNRWTIISILSNNASEEQKTTQIIQDSIQCKTA